MRLTQTLMVCKKTVENYSRFHPSPLSIKQFMEFGRKKCERTSFTFLRKELPVRLANIMMEIQLLPERLLRMPSVVMVQGWYERSFEEILKFERTNPEDAIHVHEFCEALIKIRNRHSSVVETMAQGVMELKETHPIDMATEQSIQYFLHRFYMSRISIRMLINQHAILFGSDMPGHPRHIGAIDPNCDLNTVVQDAYENSRFLCDQYYLTSPGLVVENHNVQNPEAPISICYVPSHLYHILFELIKNAMRAVVEHHDCAEPDRLPPLKLLLVKGNEDLTIKISDMGGGIPRSLSDLLFHYMYSTAPKPSQSGLNTAPLAGFGYGLPLSRLYARYFHGDLLVTSVEGFGTDAIVYLKVLSDEANELLPVFNKTSSKRYKTYYGNHDWSAGNSVGGGSNFGGAMPSEPIGLRHFSTTKNAT